MGNDTVTCNTGRLNDARRALQQTSTHLARKAGGHVSAITRSDGDSSQNTRGDGNFARIDTDADRSAAGFKGGGIQTGKALGNVAKGAGNGGLGVLHGAAAGAEYAAAGVVGFGKKLISHPKIAVTKDVQIGEVSKETSVVIPAKSSRSPLAKRIKAAAGRQVEAAKDRFGANEKSGAADNFERSGSYFRGAAKDYGTGFGDGAKVGVESLKVVKNGSQYVGLKTAQGGVKVAKGAVIIAGAAADDAACAAKQISADAKEAAATVDAKATKAADAVDNAVDKTVRATKDAGETFKREIKK